MDTYVSPAAPQAPRDASSAQPSEIFAVRQRNGRHGEAGGRNQGQDK